MKSVRLWILCSWCFTIGSMAESNVINLDHHIKISEIADRVWVATDTAFYHSNVLLVKFKDESLLIASSPFENIGTKTLMTWIKANLKPRKIVAINTHFHRDGTGGNHVYHQEGVETWSSDLTHSLLQKEIQKFPTATFDFYKDPKLKSRIKASPREPAKNRFKLKDGKEFSFSGEKVQVFFPGHAHSPDNVVVYIPNQKILFGGCMIKPKSLGYLGNADVATWPQSARNLQSFAAALVVPGHGKWGTSEMIEKTIKVAESAAKALPP